MTITTRKTEEKRKRTGNDTKRKVRNVTMIVTGKAVVVPVAVAEAEVTSAIVNIEGRNAVTAEVGVLVKTVVTAIMVMNDDVRKEIDVTERKIHGGRITTTAGETTEEMNAGEMIMNVIVATGEKVARSPITSVETTEHIAPMNVGSMMRTPSIMAKNAHITDTMTQGGEIANQNVFNRRRKKALD
jgi:hypothetical protein